MPNLTANRHIVFRRVVAVAVLSSVSRFPDVEKKIRRFGIVASKEKEAELEGSLCSNF